MINVMDEYITFTQKCFNNYLKLLYGKLYDKEIANILLDVYFDVRYSNYLDGENEKLALTKKINKALTDTYKSLLNDSDKTIFIISVSKVIELFYNLDQLYLLESQKKTVELIIDEVSKVVVDKEANLHTTFNTMLKEDIKKKKDFLDSFDSNVFYLEFDKIDKNSVIVYPEHKITFPDLYSDVAINKAREKDSISEDIASISFFQVASLIVNDLIECNFEKNYYVSLPDSFFDKKQKINRLFNIIDNPFVQDRFRVVVTYKCFTRYKSYVMEYMRLGFVFAIELDESFDYSSSSIEFLELFEKIFIQNDKYYYKDMKNNGKIKDRIVSVDEVN